MQRYYTGPKKVESITHPTYFLPTPFRLCYYKAYLAAEMNYEYVDDTSAPKSRYVDDSESQTAAIVH